MFFYITQLSSFKDEQIPRLLKNLRDLEDLLNGRVTADNITANAITTPLILDAAVTPAKISGTPQTASDSYTGDGTANRIVSLGFTPRYVVVAKTDDGTIFEALGDGSAALTSWWRLAAGTQGSVTTDWLGIVTNGFKSGSNAASLSNKNAVVYRYFAVR